MSRSNNTTNNAVYNSRRQTCGYIRGQTFYRKFNPERHLIKFPAPALAYDLSAIDQAQRAGVEKLEAFDGQGTFYRVTLAHFLESARLDDRGYGPQYVLDLTGFSVTRRGAALKQLSMFGAAR
jgi:hypothetical protein